VGAAAVVIAPPARGEVFECRRGDLLRRVVLQFADDADRLPCEVVYWKDSESPDQPQLLWKAENEIEFCINKAKGVIERLGTSGWSCTTGTERSAAELAPGKAPATPDAAIIDQEVTVEAAPVPPSPPSRPGSTLLAAAVARDLDRLQELTAASAGGFEADVPVLGDLDQDGIEDAAVVMTYHSDGVPPLPHLLAYRFDGQTFRPAARINLAASDPNVAGAHVQDVIDGVVEIQLDLLQADDPPCCPTGRARAEFVLRHGQLVRLAKDPGA
jgi:hypothetical protein